MGLPSGASVKPMPSVDASDRKFYLKAAENGNKEALKDFDAALSAQRDRPAPRPPAPPAAARPERVTPQRAEDPSDQKFYNMAADRQNAAIDLENRAASLQRDIDALGTSGGYATETMRAELNDIEAKLRSRGANSAETEGNEGLSDDELAAKYAPVLVLPDGQYDLPGDPQDFIDNSRLRKDRTLRRDQERGNNINGDNGDDFTAERVGASTDDREFLDLDNDQRGELGHSEENPASFFYEVTSSDDPAEPTKVTYWFFYPYNDGPGPQNHEGDWERITLEFDPESREPTEAVYSAHNNSHTKPVPYDVLDKDGSSGRPLVCVASGSHASYPSPGAHPTEAPFVDDHTVTDTNHDGAIDAEDDATYLDTADNLHEIVEQDFYPESGRGVHWGEIGETSHTSGPYGPSEEKAHVELE